ncbi:hypothetical protein HPB48_001447 [Haemaphysalis longicornis]|uniref:Transposable element P transposase-like GTP-binding insertion domain-containing protein n=1 Tax=Haemaphysalis longicornis TaxID=44386 RepID=A0A9J6FEV4_HAELO|nr:hypothetical protein HPB48_001447 [Haemaphysalis longicornis]
MLSKGTLMFKVEHPCDANRPLFLSFDTCHVVKNVRSQFLSHDIEAKGETSSSYIKDTYHLQKNLMVKPVRYLSRKHVYPNNIEKMSVARAIQVLSPVVRTTALEHLREQVAHTCSTSFATVGHTITFMRNFYRWFILLNMNTTQHPRQKFPDVRHYDDAGDDRLEWLEATMPMYLYRRYQKKVWRSKRVPHEGDIRGIFNHHLL